MENIIGMKSKITFQSPSPPPRCIVRLYFHVYAHITVAELNYDFYYNNIMYDIKRYLLHRGNLIKFYRREEGVLIIIKVYVRRAQYDRLLLRRGQTGGRLL